MEKEIIIGIYKITSPSNKVYIGQSWDINTRWQQYQNTNNCKSQPRIYRSLNKYGVENHTFEKIHIFDNTCSQQDLDDAEKFYIRYNKYLKIEVLNLTEGGLGTKGRRLVKIDKDLLQDLYINQNLNKPELAKIFNCKERLIKKYLTDNNIRKPVTLLQKGYDERNSKSNSRIHEKEILKLYSEGKRYKEIASKLNITVNVVSNTLSKFGVFKSKKIKGKYDKILDLSDNIIYDIEGICKKYNILKHTLREQFRLNRLKYNLQLL